MRGAILASVLSLSIVLSALLTGSASGEKLGAKPASNFPCCLLTDLTPQAVSAYKGNLGFRFTVSDYEPLRYPKIPEVRTTLYLTKGSKIVRSHFVVCCDYANHSRLKQITSLQKYTMVRTRDGVLRPQWTFRYASAQYGGTWFFWVKPSAGHAKVCVTVLAKPYGIKGAPSQTGSFCQSGTQE